MDWSMTETQVGHGNTAGLLGVISEVALCVHIGLIADDFDSALVGANRTIAAEAPEHAARGAFRGDVEYFFLREGGVRYIINDTNGEVVFRFSLLEVVEDSQGDRQDRIPCCRGRNGRQQSGVCQPCCSIHHGHRGTAVRRLRQLPSYGQEQQFS